jgi:hypothetical protein
MLKEISTAGRKEGLCAVEPFLLELREGGVLCCYLRSRWWLERDKNEVSSFNALLVVGIQLVS